MKIWEVKLEPKGFNFNSNYLYKSFKRLENFQGLMGKILNKCMQRAKKYTTEKKKPTNKQTNKSKSVGNIKPLNL